MAEIPRRQILEMGIHWTESTVDEIEANCLLSRIKHRLLDGEKQVCYLLICKSV
jgi:hypothetical protein